MGCGDQENHFNVSLILRDKVTRQCTQTGGLFAYQPSTLPLGQTGSRLSLLSFVVPIEMERKWKKHYMNSTFGSVLVVTEGTGRCYGVTVTNFLCGLCDSKPVPLELELDVVQPLTITWIIVPDSWTWNIGMEIIHSVKSAKLCRISIQLEEWANTNSVKEKRAETRMTATKC